MSIASETTGFDRTKYLDWVERSYCYDVRQAVVERLGAASTNFEVNSILRDVFRDHYQSHTDAIHALASQCCAAPPLTRTSSPSKKAT